MSNVTRNVIPQLAEARKNTNTTKFCFLSIKGENIQLMTDSINSLNLAIILSHVKFLLHKFPQTKATE